MFSVSKEIGGRTLTIETGKIAKQADGAVMVRYGDTVVFVSVVAQPIDECPLFSPLTVEYREKTSAAGKIPGGFYKREGRPTTKEILTMRMIDRPLRPLFPAWYSNEVQIIALVLSADQENDPDVPAMIGASAALVISTIPFNTPTGSVRVGMIDNQFVLNPTHSQLEHSTLDMTVTGSEQAILMVEGKADEVPENIIVDAICWAHSYIKTIVGMQQELMRQVGREPLPLPPVPPEAKIVFDFIKDKYYKELSQGLQITRKKEREKFLQVVFGKIKNEIAQIESMQAATPTIIEGAFEENQRDIIRKWITEGKREDGRGLTDIRPITCEVGILPRTHGSALFTRGETQALVTITLGTSMDEQVVEGLMPESTKRFMLHYNFPPFSVGEIQSLRGPSRREIGHGVLAEKSLEAVIPEESRFPYAIRIVSDIMESNGSSSMASVCGGTLAMMDAGIPIRKPVGGIAMGLVKDKDAFYVISDIIGNEDHYGDMDFKVAGTQRGVTGLQMDIKTAGITRDILEKALSHAREGRIHILREMMLAIDRPRREISNFAPRVICIKINPEKLAAVIGSSGKTIRYIQEKTNSKVDVKEDGTITVYCSNKEGLTQAREMIDLLSEDVKIGKIYKGKVSSVKDFGAFVEIIPGLEGLVHVSELEKNYVQNVSDVVHVGDEIYVKVLAVDDQNRIKLSKRAADKEMAEQKEKT